MLKKTAMVKWELVFTRDACKDAKKIQAAGFRVRINALFAVLRINPFQNSPPYEKLMGDLAGAYSRRINIKHRLVYQVFKAKRVVKILRMWTHYE
ncbi:MAG: Txe/YoeB family addiction module toxin [Elusimicrobia bacterium]|nr:Txe/YoeB family addiction module toxin [Elusimicrobiota bacterium]